MHVYQNNKRIFYARLKGGPRSILIGQDSICGSKNSVFCGVSVCISHIDTPFFIFQKQGDFQC